ncbi:pyruvate kinase [Paracoccaceae bacterium]|nr:pyruvate kinase [Paracoccaceae bacterium]
MRSLIITVGPAFWKDVQSLTFKTEFVSPILRINGAHTDSEDLKSVCDRIIEKFGNGTRILLDLPGNKIRAKFSEPLKFKKDTPFNIPDTCFNITSPRDIFKKGQILNVFDSRFQFEVIEVSKEAAVGTIFMCARSGELPSGKGFHCTDLTRKLPILLDKDKALIDAANFSGVTDIGLSFVRNQDDIDLVRAELPEQLNLIPKIETASAIQNLESILHHNKLVILDRGDLSTDVGLVNVPKYVKLTLERSMVHNTRVIIATQYLKSMETSPVPLISELSDIYNTLNGAAHGIQLSEETAVGQFPNEVIKIVDDIIYEIYKNDEDYSTKYCGGF